jgi:hypothetical protein
MATKVYRFLHELGSSEATARVRPVLDELLRTYQLTLDTTTAGKFRLHRTGVDANVTVGDNEILVTVDLNWFLEKAIRSKLDDQLHEKIRPILKA